MMPATVIRGRLPRRHVEVAPQRAQERTVPKLVGTDWGHIRAEVIGQFKAFGAVVPEAGRRKR